MTIAGAWRAGPTTKSAWHSESGEATPCVRLHVGMLIVRSPALFRERRARRDIQFRWAWRRISERRLACYSCAPMSRWSTTSAEGGDALSIHYIRPVKSLRPEGVRCL